MDPWFGAFANLGIGGAMCCAIVWFLRYLVMVTLPEMVRSFTDQLDKERAASERRYEGILSRMDRDEAAQVSRHAENQAALKELRHMIRALDASVATFTAIVGDHLGLVKLNRHLIAAPERQIEK